MSRPSGKPAPPRRRRRTAKARDLASWILTDPDNLDDEEKEKLARAREHCPHLDARAGHVTEFTKILTGLHGDRLDDWLAAVDADDQPDLHSFAYGIKRDQQAVLNRLTMPWNSGVVEGNVSRLKIIKRQMYGRATFPCSASVLLCQRLGRDGVETITKYGSDPRTDRGCSRVWTARGRRDHSGCSWELTARHRRGEGGRRPGGYVPALAPQQRFASLRDWPAAGC